MKKGEEIRQYLNGAKDDFDLISSLGEKYSEEMNSYMRSDDLPPNMKQRLTNPEEITMAKEMLSFDAQLAEYENKIIANNKCSFSEYRDKFAFLHVWYENSGCANMDEYTEKRKEISEEYLTRFSIHHPIQIHADDDPDNILVSIPKQQRELKLISGSNTMYIDQFYRFATNDRPDIRRNANDGLLYSFMESQKVHIDDLEQEKRETAEATVKVLRLFYPEHPLLKKMDQEALGKAAEKSVESEEDKPQNLDMEDFGL